MNFWKTAASPTLLDLLTFFPQPGYIRKTPALRPIVKGFEPDRATVDAVEEITQFWNMYYKGSDWRMNLSTEHVASYLKDPTVYVIALKNHNNLIATIVSTPCPLAMSHGGECHTARIIEGLVVHPLYREQGIAGLMIAYADYLTSQKGPVCHLWAREEMIPSPLSTAIAKQTYSYALPEEIVLVNHTVNKIPWEKFLEENPVRQPKGKVPWVSGVVPQNRRGDLDVWRSLNAKGKMNWQHVIVANTRRVETKTNRPIYEIIWCSSTPQTGLLESIVSHYNGPVFTTIPSSELTGEWHTGRSGYQLWYMYNYIPPAFGNCVVDLIREEL
jgi:hypothetical protein